MLQNRLFGYSVVFCFFCLLSAYSIDITPTSFRDDDVIYDYSFCGSSYPFSHLQQEKVPCIPSFAVNKYELYRNYSNVLLTKYRRKSTVNRLIQNQYKTSNHLNHFVQFKENNEEYLKNIEIDSFQSFFVVSLVGDHDVYDINQSSLYVMDNDKQQIYMHLQDCACSSFNTVFLLGFSGSGDVWLSGGVSPLSIEIWNSNIIKLDVVRKQCSFSFLLSSHSSYLISPSNVTSNVNSTNDTRLTSVVVIFLIEIAVLTSIAFVLLY